MLGRFLVIVAVGLLTRLVPLGNILWDKYLGDALYAAMVCTLVRPTWVAALVMVAIECFQLTGIPAGLLASDSLPLRLLARALGTHFSLLDLAAYAVGIAAYRATSEYLARRATAPPR